MGFFGIFWSCNSHWNSDRHNKWLCLKRSEKDTSKVSTSTTTTTPSSTVAMTSQNGSSGNGKPNSGIVQQNQNQLQIAGGK